MNANAKAWVAALLSGKYRQGKSRLAGVDADGKVRYCCLGVACELAVRAKVCKRRMARGGSYLYDGQVAYPPASVVAWLGGSECILADGATRSVYAVVAEMNDKGDTFAQIATVIEEQGKRTVTSVVPL